MIFKNEKQLINIIKYTPSIFIISISIIMTLFLYLEKQNELEKEKIFIQDEFIKKNKELAKEEVENLYAFITKTQEKTEEKLKKILKKEFMKLIISPLEFMKKIKTLSQKKKL